MQWEKKTQIEQKNKNQIGILNEPNKNPHFFNRQNHFETQNPITTALKSLPPFAHMSLPAMPQQQLILTSLSNPGQTDSASLFLTHIKPIKSRSLDLREKKFELQVWPCGVKIEKNWSACDVLVSCEGFYFWFICV